MAEQQEVRVAWLAGSRDGRRKTLARIKSLIGPHEDVRIGEGDTFSQLEAQVLGGDCFGTKRLVIVDALPEHPGSRATYMSHMKKLMDRVPEDCFLLLNGLSDQALANHVKVIGKTFVSEDEVQLDRAVAMVADRIKEEGKAIEAEDAKRLVKMLPTKERNYEHFYDVDQLNLVVDKLVAYTDKRKNVTTEDVLMVVPNNATTTSWAMYDALDDKDFDKALAIFHKLWPTLVASEGGMDKAANFLLAGLLWRFRLLLVLKEAKSPAEATGNAKALLKLSQTGVGLEMRFTAEGQAYSDGMIGRTMGAYGPSPLVKYTMKRLVQVVEAVEASVEQSRYISTRAEYLLLAESLLMLACEKIDDSTRRKLSLYYDERRET